MGFLLIWFFVFSKQGLMQMGLASVAENDLELMILLSLCPNSWDYTCMPLPLTAVTFYLGPSMVEKKQSKSISVPPICLWVSHYLRITALHPKL